MPRRPEPSDYWQAHPNYIHFSVLRRACETQDLKARLHIFEGGETVEITTQADSRPVCRITREYGDGENATAATAIWLIERKYLTVEDIKNASVD